MKKTITLLLLTFVCGIGYSQLNTGPYSKVEKKFPEFSGGLCVSGTILDEETKQAIPFATAFLYAVDLAGDLIPIDTFKAQQEGKYFFNLKSNQDYLVVGNAPELSINEVKFQTSDDSSSDDLKIDIELGWECHYMCVAPIVLENIYFDSKKSHLRPESILELEKLALLLKNNPQITIQLGAHCDSTESKHHSMKLTEARTQSTQDCLVKMGIEPGRIFFAAMGYSEPLIYPELNDADEQLNRRVEFRIKDFDYGQKPVAAADTNRLLSSQPKNKKSRPIIAPLCSGTVRNCSSKRSTPFVTTFIFIPDLAVLGQNYPNPFAETTAIPYELPLDAQVKLTLYDFFGGEIKTLVNEFQKAGTYAVEFNAENLVQGSYFYKIECGNFSETKKMTVVK